MLARHVFVLSATAATAAVAFYFLPERPGRRFPQSEVPVAQLGPVPAANLDPSEPTIPGIELVGVKTLGEALDALIA